MSSSWTAFRAHWIKPDIYPLIGVMTGALSLGTFASIHSLNSPSVLVDADLRRTGFRPGEGTEYEPMLIRFKNTSTGVFATDMTVWDRHTAITEPLSFTIRIGDEADDEEGAAEEAAVGSEEQPSAYQTLKVIDESAATINAAIDESLAVTGRNLTRRPLDAEEVSREGEEVTI